MIISHKLKYVYVAIPKTGSSSITTKLRDSNEFEYSIMGYHQKFMEEILSWKKTKKNFGLLIFPNINTEQWGS